MVYICFSISLQDICQSHTLQIPFSSNFLHMFAHLHNVWRWVIDIDFLTVAGQDMQDLQRPPPAPFGVSPLRRGLVPLYSIVFRQFSQLFRCEGVDKLTHACVASDQAGPEGNTKKKYTAKSAGRKVRRAGELCQSTVSTFVTASDAKSSGCTASHRCTRGRERAKREREGERGMLFQFTIFATR